MNQQSEASSQKSELAKPFKAPVSLDVARREWLGSGRFLFQRKYDGVFAVREVRSQYSEATILGEWVKARSGSILTAEDRELLAGGQSPKSKMPSAGGTFFAAFDVAVFNGENLANRPLRERWQVLKELFQQPAASSQQSEVILAEHVEAEGAEFLDRVLAAGGEGVCAKEWDGPLRHPMYAAKRIETFDLLVTGKVERTGVIEVAEFGVQGSGFIAGEARGNCPAKAMFDRIAIGDVVEVAALGLTAAGKLREPRFVRIRQDKMIQRGGAEARMGAVLTV